MVKVLRWGAWCAMLSLITGCPVGCEPGYATLNVVGPGGEHVYAARSTMGAWVDFADVGTVVVGPAVGVRDDGVGTVRVLTRAITGVQASCAPHPCTTTETVIGEFYPTGGQMASFDLTMSLPGTITVTADVTVAGGETFKAERIVEVAEATELVFACADRKRCGDVVAVPMGIELYIDVQASGMKNGVRTRLLAKPEGSVSNELGTVDTYDDSYSPTLIVGVTRAGIGVLTGRAAGLTVEQPLKVVDPASGSLEVRQWNPPVDVDDPDPLTSLGAAVTDIELSLSGTSTFEGALLARFSDDSVAFLDGEVDAEPQFVYVGLGDGLIGMTAHDVGEETLVIRASGQMSLRIVVRP